MLRQRRLRVVEVGGRYSPHFDGTVLSSAIQNAIAAHPFEVAFTIEIEGESGTIVFSKGYSGAHTLGLFHASMEAWIGDSLSGAIDAAIDALKADQRFLGSIR